MSKPENSNENIRRNHDGFLKYVYSNPENTRTLLHLAEKGDKDLADMLAEVDLETLEEIPEAYNEVGSVSEPPEETARKAAFDEARKEFAIREAAQKG